MTIPRLLLNGALTWAGTLLTFVVVFYSLHSSYVEDVKLVENVEAFVRESASSLHGKRRPAFVSLSCFRTRVRTEAPSLLTSSHF